MIGILFKTMSKEEQIEEELEELDKPGEYDKPLGREGQK